MILRAILAVLLLLASGTASAQAHKLKVYAAAKGEVIAGHAYFVGGTRAPGVPVTIAGRDGVPVFQGVTDAEGRFAYTVTHRMDHIVTADGGDGHQGRYTVKAANLPESLPEPATPQPAKPAQAKPDKREQRKAEKAPAELAALIDEAVARQVGPLREQLDAYQSEIRLRDVVGGLGYIVGLGGLAFGLSRRRG